MDKPFDTFTKDDILREEGGVLKWKGHDLSQEVAATLKAEAHQLSSSTLWKILKAELQWYAMKSLMEKGETSEDIRVARIFGNVVAVIDDKLKSI